MNKYFLPFLVAIIFIACGTIQTVNNSNFSDENSIRFIKGNMEILASDEFEGREAITHGEDLAALFISNEFKKYGVKPFKHKTNYYQNFDVAISKLSGETGLSLISGEQIKELKFNEDFLLGINTNPNESLNDQEFEMVFVSYGITAPEYKYNDYEGVDVKDKIVLIYPGEPFSEDSTFFNGMKPSKYLNPVLKANLALTNGASGAIFIPNKMLLSYWDQLKYFSNRASLKLKVDNTSEKGTDSKFKPYYIFSEAGAKELLYSEDYEYSEIKELIKDNEDPERFYLDKKLKIKIDIEKNDGISKNVIAMIEGADPELKNEYVVIGAHYDHEGIQQGEIYNGANDNASGTCTVMEVARQMTQMQTPKRSILFCAWGAEEKGIHGSKYFIDNIPENAKVFANINMDCVGRESADTIVCIGSGRLSDEMYDIVKSENNEFYLDYSLDKNDPSNHFGRSDNIHFHRAGIPVVSFADNMSEDLHKPTDDHWKINYLKLSRLARYVSRIADELANLDHQLELKELTSN